MSHHTPDTNQTNDQAYLKPYQEYEDKNGTEFGVTLWATPQSQQLRFKIFTQLAFMLQKSILDIGSSRGDFASYLLEKQIHYKHYTGIDGLKDVIKFAQSRNIPNTNFECADILADPQSLRRACPAPPQVVTISGTLNTMSDEQAGAVLENAWSITGEILVFNFLSDRSGRKATPQDYPARRLNTLGLLDWAFSKTSLVKFTQDYFSHGHDATILMRKEPVGD